MAEQQSEKELENYIREKQEEGRRINEERAHPVETPDPRRSNAGKGSKDRDVPPDAEGHEEEDDQPEQDIEQ